MKDLKRLEIRMRISEAFHLALLAICAASSLALLFMEDDPIYRFLWALGTVIPVLLIWAICLFIKKKLIRYLLTAAVFAAAIFITRKEYHFVYYLLTCIPITVSGLFLPRPKGRLVFSIPNVPSLFAPFVPYAIGQTFHLPTLSRAAVALCALVTLNYFLYLNQSRLLMDIRMSVRTEVSVSGLIRQNRRVVALFLTAGALVLAAVPFMLKAAPPATEDVKEADEELQTPAPTAHIALPKDFMFVTPEKEYTLDIIPIVLGFILASATLFAIGSLVMLIVYLIGRIERGKKHAPPDVKETMTVEKLEPERMAKEKEHLSGYEKKIRRRYEKLIRSRAPKGSRLAPMTPTELEREADIEGEGADAIHTIYRNVRYSGKPADREDFAAFKDAVRSLPKPRRAEDKQG